MLTVLVSRVLLPFSVPPLVVHESGYIEICSWQGGWSRVLIDAEGQRIESEEPFSYCPQCALAGFTSLPERPYLAEQPLVWSSRHWLDLDARQPASLSLSLPPARGPPTFSLLLIS